jgi:hypothetical protein
MKIPETPQASGLAKLKSELRHVQEGIGGLEIQLTHTSVQTDGPITPEKIKEDTRTLFALMARARTLLKEDEARLRDEFKESSRCPGDWLRPAVVLSTIVPPLDGTLPEGLCAAEYLRKSPTKTCPGIPTGATMLMEPT